MHNFSEILVRGFLVFCPVLVAILAVRRVKMWHVGQAEKVLIISGLLKIPKRFLHDVHEVVSSDKYSAWMHVFTAGGFLAVLLCIYLVYGFGFKSLFLIHALTAVLMVLVFGALLVGFRRRFRPQAKTKQLSNGVWNYTYIAFLLFAISFLIVHFTSYYDNNIFKNPQVSHYISLGSALVFVASGLILVSSAVSYDPLKHAFTGALHLAFHPRADKFDGKFVSTALKPLDLNAEKLGVSAISDFSWVKLLEFDACVQCGRCEVACPALAAGQPLNPKKLIQDMVHGFDSASRKYAGREHGGDLLAATDKLKDKLINDETIWSCTTCRACVHECPMFIDHVDTVIDFRRALTLDAAATPRKGAEVLENIYLTDNSHGVNNSRRFNWASDLNVPIMAEKKKVDVLLWVGDYAFDSINHKSLRSLVEILQMADVDFAILGNEETDTGDLARRLGDEALFLTCVDRVANVLLKYDFNQILTPDPHVLHSLQKEYSDLGHNYTVVHHTQFVAALVAESKILLDKPIPKSITYHDPCYLGRYSGEVAAPRALIEGLGANFIEMERSGLKSRCCGGGGGAAISDIPGKKRIPDIRMQDVKETGTDIVAVACPNCRIMLDGVNDASAQIVDIIELVREAVSTNG